MDERFGLLGQGDTMVWLSAAAGEMAEDGILHDGESRQ